MDKTLPDSRFDELRSRAEELVKERAATSESSGADILSLIHELEVHQIELQMQNEELQDARRKMDEAWRAYAELFESAPNGYVTLSGEGIITRVNRTASGMLSIPKEGLERRGFSSFVHPMDHRDYFQLIREADGKVGGRTGEIRLLRARIVPFWAQVDVSPSFDGNGHLTGWRVTFVDISDRKQAQQEQKKFAEKLERSNRELQDFAFIASHDLQEPLRKIQSFSNMVVEKAKKGVFDDASSDYLRRVQGAAVRLQELLRALLKYSRVSTQSKPFSRCNLRKAVEDVVSDLDLTIDRTRGKIEISDLPVIQADTAQIRQLFQNVITNALKFHKGDTPPMVKVYSLPGDKDTCSIAVEDNGIGFEEEFTGKIFAPFQRLHDRSSQYQGTGMGLAICRKIVERHGGSITARSAPGKGSTFIINLPCKQKPDSD